MAYQTGTMQDSCAFSVDLGVKTSIKAVKPWPNTRNEANLTQKMTRSEITARNYELC